MTLSRALRVCCLTALGCIPTLGSAQAQTLPSSKNGHDLLILIDQTGSMNLTEDTAMGRMTRFAYAKKRALEWLEIQPRDNAGDAGVGPADIKPSEISLWTFGEQGLREEVAFTRNFDRIEDAIRNLHAPPKGGTPLAKAVCDSSIILRDFSGDDVQTQKHLYIATDGGENRTPLSDICGGYPSRDEGGYPNFTVDSWEWHVRNMLLVGDADFDPMSMVPPMQSDHGVILDVDFIMDVQFDDEAMRSAAPSFRGAPRVPQQTLRELGLFSGLTRATGGTLIAGVDDRPFPAVQPAPGVPSQPNPQPGPTTPRAKSPDIDGSGCVDGQDIDLLFALVREHGATASAATSVADLNGDGAVDNDDYLVIMDNLRQGPNCT